VLIGKVNKEFLPCCRLSEETLKKESILSASFQSCQVEELVEEYRQESLLHLFMANIASENWYLKKYEDKSLFGPMPFSKLIEWAQSAQIAPHDVVSEDQVVWTKAPMIPELEMDWLVQLDDHLYYGPTTGGAILEFFSLGEISPETIVVNCKDATECKLKECDFFPDPDDFNEAGGSLQPSKGSLRYNLQRRIRELESALLEKQRRLLFAEDTVRRLEKRIQELEPGGFKK